MAVVEIVMEDLDWKQMIVKLILCLLSQQQKEFFTVVYQGFASNY